MTPLARIEALKAKAATFDSPDAAACTLFDEAMALASELAAESEWRPVSEEPELPGRYLVRFEDDGMSWLSDEDWNGERWSANRKCITHWRPMPRGPER
jgi:hypothetical protein